jgi:hypothetical protein
MTYHKVQFPGPLVILTSLLVQCASLGSLRLNKQKPFRAFHANYTQRLQQLSHNTGAAEKDQQ